MSEKLSADQEVIERMQVPDRQHLYVLGCFEARITLFTQQVRALNLIYALRESFTGPVSLAVVGGGVGGLTAAAAAATKLGWSVTVIEERASLVHLQDRCERWIHPHIYEWPQPHSQNASAGLHILDWTEGTADKVVSELRDKWKVVAAERKITVYTSATDLGIEPLANGRHLLRWNAKRMEPGVQDETWGSRMERRLHLREFDVVIMAVGFGVETSTIAFPTVRSYWDRDNLDREDLYTTRETRKVLVSGTGDGGLIDVLRLSFKDFRHDQILKQLQRDWLIPADVTRVESELLQLDEAAFSLHRDGKPYEAELNLGYRRLADCLKIKKIPTRENICTVLTGRSPFPFDLGSARLNRFLFSLTNAEYIPGPIEQVVIADKDREVTFKSGRKEKFDEVVIRHGPKSALERSFPEVWKLCTDMIKIARATPDPTREPLYGAFYGPPETVQTPIREGGGLLSAETAALITVLHRHPREDLMEAWRTYQQTFASAVLHNKNYLVPRLIRKTGAGREDPTRQAQEEMAPVKILEVNQTHALIIGARGTGKTALLYYLASRCAERESAFPVFGHLRNLRITAGTPPELLFDSCLRTSPDAPEMPILRGHFRQCLAQGRVTLFLNGLDELEASDRAQWQAWLADFLSGPFSHNSVIVTARTASLSCLPDTELYEIAPLNAEQRKTLIENAIPDQETARFLSRWLIHGPIAEAFASTPRGLWYWMSILSQNKEALEPVPTSIIAFWNKVDTMAPALPASVEVLEALAYHVCTSDSPSFTVDEIDHLALPKGVDLEAFMPDWLVWEFESRSLRFTHRLFAELFAAQGLAKRPHAVESIAALGSDPQYQDAFFPAMAIGFLGNIERAFALLHELPDSVDLALLRLQARSLRFLEDVPRPYVTQLATQLRELILQPDAYGDKTLIRGAASFAGIGPAVSATVMKELAAPLADREASIRRRTVLCLAALRSAAAVGPLSEVMQHDPEQSVREEAARALGEIGDSQAIPTLLEAYLHGRDTLVFDAALQAIVRIGGSEAVSLLLSILENKNLSRNLRWPVAGALAELHDAAAWPLLRESLSDEASVVREHAATALGLLGDADAVEGLQTCLRDEDPIVRWASAQALGRIGDLASAPSLVNALQEEHPMVREAAFLALRKLDETALVEAIGQGISTPQATWHSDAVRFAAELMQNDALPTLKALAHDSSAAVREAVAAGLGFLEGEEPAQMLIAFLTDSATRVRHVAAKSLERTRPASAVSALIARLAVDDSGLVLMYTARALAAIRSKDAVDPLIALLEQGKSSSFMAATALGRLGDERAIPPLAETARRFAHNRDASMWSIGALAKLGTPKAIQALQELWVWQDASNRSLTMWDLHDLPLAEATVAFLKGISDENPTVRLPAWEGLRTQPLASLKEGLRAGLRSTDAAIRRGAVTLIPYYADESVCNRLEELSLTESDTGVLSALNLSLPAARQKAHLIRQAAEAN